jgi:hypothetical protein
MATVGAVEVPATVMELSPAVTEATFALAVVCAVLAVVWALLAVERAVDELVRADTTPEFSCRFSTALATGKQLGVEPITWAKMVVPS